MKHVLVIIARPQTPGHNKIIIGKVASLFKERKDIKVNTIDLYKDKFNPVLSAKEHYTSGNYELAPEVKKYQKLVTEADRLLFIYPVWWGSMPAILKGFFDKVFTSHYAFKYSPLKFKLFGIAARPVGLLKGKKAAVLNTMGSPMLVDWLTLRYPSFLIQFGILGFCGIRARVFTTHKCLACDEKKKVHLEAKATKAVNWLLE